MRLLLLLLLNAVLMNVYSKIYKTTILKTPIFKVFNFHKLILVENSREKYLIDFAPVPDITKPGNMIKLLSNQNVEGKIYVYSYNSLDEHNYKKSIKQINDQINDEIVSDIVSDFSTSFNFYSNNCCNFVNYCEESINRINNKVSSNLLYEES